MLPRFHEVTKLFDNFNWGNGNSLNHDQSKRHTLSKMVMTKTTSGSYYENQRGLERQMKTLSNNDLDMILLLITDLGWDLSTI